MDICGDRDGPLSPSEGERGRERGPFRSSGGSLESLHVRAATCIGTMNRNRPGAHPTTRHPPSNALTDATWDGHWMFGSWMLGVGCCPGSSGNLRADSSLHLDHEPRRAKTDPSPLPLSPSEGERGPPVARGRRSMERGNRAHAVSIDRVLQLGGQSLSKRFAGPGFLGALRKR